MKKSYFITVGPRTLSLALVLAISMTQLSAQEENQGQQNQAQGEGEENVLFQEQDFAPIDLKNEAKKRIYKQIPLEDFETNSYTNQNIDFRSINFKQARITVRQEYPAPTKDSKKYLGVKVFGKREDAVKIFPAQPVMIDNYCKQLNIWAYGKGLSASLYVLIKDNKRNTHYLRFGQLNFHGWRRLTLPIPDVVQQQDYYLNQNSGIKVVALVFNPGNTGAKDQWNYTYLDDFTAIIRQKYTDRQRDNW